MRRAAILLATAASVAAAEPPARPVDVTARTLADPVALADLERPGRLVFADGFESAASASLYFEIGGLKEGTVTWDRTPGLARSGTGALKCVVRANGGKSAGSGANVWFGPDGYDRLYFRRWIRFAADYDQGNLHHVGGWLDATAGRGQWDDMGTAGHRPRGDDWFSTSFEPWCDWRRVPPPGWMFLYVYWPDMTRDPDGHWWGNMFMPPPEGRLVLLRDRWYCLEHMVRTNAPGRADGEIAAWVDGKLYLHVTGFRWRTSPRVKLKRISFGGYVHQSTRENVVWFDDVAVSTGYLAP